MKIYNGVPCGVEGGGEHWTCDPSKQWFDHRQLEKVVNLDENSWTPTKIINKRSLCSDGQVDRVDVWPQ
jgi:hypothetical protein